MRIAVALLFAAACGGSSPAPVTPANSGEPAPSSEPTLAAGSTGVGTLTWGADEAAIMAEFPQATANPQGGLWEMGSAQGMSAITVFDMQDGKLAGIRVEFTEGLISMDACSKKWTELRATFDGTFGPSQSDNLAAYWNTATTAIVMDCSPNESGAGILAITYAPPTAE